MIHWVIVWAIDAMFTIGVMRKQEDSRGVPEYAVCIVGMMIWPLILGCDIGSVINKART